MHSESAAADGDAARWVRTLRRARRISQRELAEIAQVPRSTVDRIEAGSTDPRFGTFQRLCESTGYVIVLMDHRGRFCLVPPAGGRHVDRGGRTFPAHLPSAETPHHFSRSTRHWWGWHCIAWPFTDDWVPEHTFWKRPVPPQTIRPANGPFELGRVWDDAT